MAVKAVLQREQYIWNLQYLESHGISNYIPYHLWLWILKLVKPTTLLTDAFQNPFWKNEGLIKSRQN